jgi:ribosomal protein S17E
MKREKVIKRVDEALSAFYLDGFDAGFDSGYLDGLSEGAEAHKTMIRNRITMHIETCMNTNKFKEAQFAKEMLEYLMWEYDPEKAAKEQGEQEENEDGFGIIF